MTKRRIGEQSADRDYVKYLQNNMGPDFFTKPRYFNRLKTRAEFDNEVKTE